MAVIINGKGVQVEVPDEWLTDGTLDTATPGWKPVPAEKPAQKRRTRAVKAESGSDE